MKTLNMIFKSLLVGFVLMLSAGLYAQDPVEVAPNVYKKVILDNEKVRVIQVEFAPGEVAPWHHHPAHVIYVLAGGKMEITEKGKEAQVMDLNDGDAMYMPAVSHMGKNIGTTTIKLIVTEMKPIHKMMDGKMMDGKNMMKKESGKM
ncbi:MAG: cupin domain-containing protein [Bacteroidota bacterium]|nr:cupin domain-containing protein [Bacteroidota bacterium]